MQQHWNKEGISIASEHDVIMMIYGAVPEARHFEALQHVEEEVLAKNAHGMTIFNLMTRPSKMLGIGSEARTLAMSLGRRMASRTNVIANVVEGDGFFAATCRSLLASIAMLGAQPFPQKTFSSRGEGADWIVPLHNTKSPHKFTEHAWRALFEDVWMEFTLVHGK